MDLRCCGHEASDPDWSRWSEFGTAWRGGEGDLWMRQMKSWFGVRREKIRWTRGLDGGRWLAVASSERWSSKDTKRMLVPGEDISVGASMSPDGVHCYLPTTCYSLPLVHWLFIFLIKYPLSVSLRHFRWLVSYFHMFRHELDSSVAPASQKPIKHTRRCRQSESIWIFCI